MSAMNVRTHVVSIVAGLLLGISVASGSEQKTSAKSPRGPKYKSQSVDFEAMVVEGQIRRPEISVITGNVDQGTDGLLRLRNDFADRLASDAGEEL